ncbi:MAG: L,D-transpeptidase [Candidatus Dormibacteria bacterium]
MSTVALPGPSAAAGTMPRRLLRAVLVSAVIAAFAVLGLVVLGQGPATSARLAYVHDRALAVAALQQAQTLGYSDSDLAAPRAQLAALEGAQVPGLASQPAFYREQQNRLGLVRQSLAEAEATAMAAYRAESLGQVDQLASALTSAGPVLDAVDLPLARAAVAALPQKIASASNPIEVKRTTADLQSLMTQVADLVSSRHSEQEAIAAAAASLKQEHQGKVDEIRAAGTNSLKAGRNDSTVAALLKLSALDRDSRKIEEASTGLTSADPDVLATAAATAAYFAADLHNAMLKDMPGHTIVISLTGQELWAYQDGGLVKDTLVTTGRPALATDVGAMKVLWKQAPWKMHSPWPRTSQWWYPDTTVREVVWFTATGEGMHDASWEPPSVFGPGSELSTSASHGCVHVPDAAEDFIFAWANPGDSVIVYPGDGTPAQTQLKQVSVDDQGVPFTGPKGA